MIVDSDLIIRFGEKRADSYQWVTCDANGAVWGWKNEPFRNRASGEWVLRNKEVEQASMGIEYDVIHEFGQEIDNWDKLKFILEP